MSNWQSKSDFEINLAVAKLMPPIVSENQSASLKSKASSVLVNDIVSEWEFNPCNNPSDAWPIILENGICTNAMAGGDFTLWYAHDKYHTNVDSAVYDENPLRAAMIVYLEMKGVKS